MYLATFDAGRHFTFTALGHTEQEAREALAAGWAVHCRQYPGADPDYFDPDEDVNVTRMPVGVALRDGDPIQPATIAAA